jgi:sortase (surface protein transpeptidase)
MSWSTHKATRSPTKPKPKGFYAFFWATITATALCLVGYASLTLFESSTNQIETDSYQLATTYSLAAYAPELPVQLMIPSIGVSTTVQLVGLADDNTGAMGVPDTFTDVGWYKYGPRPGMVGSAVIAGHFNGKDTPEAVFYDLRELAIGDTVTVTDENGVSLIFQVVKMRTYAYDEPADAVFVSTDGKVRLNLITCGGNWLQNENLYDQRTVVFTELVS